MSSEYDDLTWCTFPSSEISCEDSLNILDLNQIKLQIISDENKEEDTVEDTCLWFYKNILHSSDSCYLYLGDYNFDDKEQRLKCLILISKAN